MAGYPGGSSPFSLIGRFLFSILFLLQITVKLFAGPSVVRDGGGGGGGIPQCYSFDCGDGVEIRYPLWNSSESGAGYCGYENLGIDCRGGHPVLRLGGDIYRVSNVSYGTRTITLVDEDLLGSGSRCPRARHNLTLRGNGALAETDADAHLLFFFNCSSGGNLTDDYKISCLPRGVNRDNYVLLDLDGGTPPASYPQDCEEVVNSTVLAAAVQHVLRSLLSSFGEVLQLGFHLQWQPAYTTNCASCEREGGSCGYAYNKDEGAFDLLCICNNGTHAGNCSGPRGIAGRKRAVIIVIVVLTAFVAVMVGLLLCLWGRRRRLTRRRLLRVMQPSTESYHCEDGDQADDFDLQLIHFSTLEVATNYFSLQNKLGEGGYGPVYKGKLPNEQYVAIKRLSKVSTQGLEEFKSEVKLVVKLQHTNLVRLLGYCIENEEKILVYEYMENLSLDKFIFDVNKGKLLDWPKRLRIIEGITQGLLYLHKYSRLRVVHRDLKASNILLDNEWNPKIADFGLARIFSWTDDQANTAHHWYIWIHAPRVCNERAILDKV